MGNVAVDANATTNQRTAVLDSRRSLGRFAVLARAIRREGSLAGIQLANAPSGLTPSRRWLTRNRDEERDRLRALVSSFDRDDLAKHLANFATSSSLAIEAGFEVVQVHAAHGYLLSLLLHPAINRRVDAFSVGASWLEQFFTELRAAIGDAILSVRLSAVTGLSSEDVEIDWTKALSKRVASAGVDIVDLSAGFYTIDRRLIYPGKHWSTPVFSRWIGDLADGLPCLLTVAGRITDLRDLPDSLPPNVLIAIGRSLIADPAFAAKTFDNRFDDIKHCALKNRCHYYSRGREMLECGVNPHL